MIGFRLVVTGIALALGFAAPAAAQSVRTIPVGTNIDWSYERDGPRARYRSGDVELAFAARREGDDPEMYVPLLTVRMPGAAPVTLEGELTSPSFEHRVTVGRWDLTRSYVLFQSFSGGAHCCTTFELVYPEEGRARVVDLGEWDGGYWDDLPTDRNGDGRLDFVFVDNAFYYAFASYAESWAPPTLRNVVGGEVVDVSTDPSFRSVYEEALARARRACVSPEDGASPNGACPAYVAAAARVGQFDRAWDEMLRSYDPAFEWPLPTGCKVNAGEQGCPEDQQVEYDNYPDALRAFLIDLGYITR